MERNECKKTILELNAEEMKAFFLEDDKYFNLKLPEYFTFTKLLKDLSEKIDEEAIKNVPKGAGTCNRNYAIITNKDGHYAWRKLEIIHPFLYVQLVNVFSKSWEQIKSRFKEFEQARGNNIIVASIPQVNVENESHTKASIMHWWEEVEQQSIILSMEYSYMIRTDIQNCYPSFYTHSVPWAIHSKAKEKEEQNKKGCKENKEKKPNGVGNEIDKILRDMCWGQTNGIPQGSVLMDFIAEIILGYIDTLLNEKLNDKHIKEYKIIRYRDDYKIFTNSPVIGEEIIKCLAEVLIEFGMNLNSQKTTNEDSVINASIKKDKLHFKLYETQKTNLVDQLLMIYNFGRKHNNSGQIKKLLNKCNEDFTEDKYISKYTQQQIEVAISITTNIAYENPGALPQCITMISKLLSRISDSEKADIIQKIRDKFSNKINNDYFDIWMQRLTYKVDAESKYTCELCNIVSGSKIDLWKSDFLDSMKDIKSIIDTTPIIDQSILEKMSAIIPIEESNDFESYSS